MQDSPNAPSSAEDYLFAWESEHYRLRATLRHFIESVALEFSPDEIEDLIQYSSHMQAGGYDCAWRLLIPKYMRHFGHVSGGAIYCFGCAQGNTVETYAHAFARQGLPLPHMNLFDSFEGLPEESRDVSPHPYWSPGKFKYDKATFLETLNALGLKDDQYSVFPGFFDQVLTRELLSQGGLQRASLIDIDCDLYRSSFEALEFMFSNQLVCEGTFIAFDDWGDTQQWVEGESRAFKEICAKYDTKAIQVFSWGRRPVMRKLFYVLRFSASKQQKR